MDSRDANPTTESRCTTTVKVERFNFTWVIENFSFCKKEVDQALESHVFRVGAKNETAWRLRLFPQGKFDEGKNHLSVYVELVASSMAETRTKLKFFIVAGSGQKKPVTSGCDGKVWTITAGVPLRIPNFILLEYLLNERNGLLPGDKLTILCKGTVAMDSIDVSGYSARLPVRIPECAILEKFGSLFENGEFSDFTLAVGGEELRVHKAILAAQSPVFAAMFQHDMLRENKQNRAAITDTDCRVLKEMLVYMYSGSSPNIREMAKDLLVAADKYDLDGLKAMCEEVLCSTLVVDNAAESLEFADKYRATQLKAQALHLINTYIKDVMTTQAWKDMILRNPRLIVEEFGSSSAS